MVPGRDPRTRWTAPLGPSDLVLGPTGSDALIPRSEYTDVIKLLPSSIVWEWIFNHRHSSLVRFYELSHFKHWVWDFSWTSAMVKWQRLDGIKWRWLKGVRLGICARLNSNQEVPLSNTKCPSNSNPPFRIYLTVISFNSYRLRHRIPLGRTSYFWKFRISYKVVLETIQFFGRTLYQQRSLFSQIGAPRTS